MRKVCIVIADAARPLFRKRERGIGMNARIRLVGGTLSIKPSSRAARPTYGDRDFAKEERFVANAGHGKQVFDGFPKMPLGSFEPVAARHGWYVLQPQARGAIRFKAA